MDFVELATIMLAVVFADVIFHGDLPVVRKVCRLLVDAARRFRVHREIRQFRREQAAAERR